MLSDGDPPTVINITDQKCSGLLAYGRPREGSRVMKRVLLVSMPFASIASPSLGLSLLKAGLTRDGLPCDIRYLNLDFARRIGAWRYDRIANFMPDLLLGDWIFAAEVFGDRIPAAERYFAEVVHPTFAQTFEHEQAETYSADRDGEILEVQAQVG